MRSIVTAVLGLILILTMLVATACAPLDARDIESTELRRRSGGITATELADLQELNAEQAIQRLRPTWLKRLAGRWYFLNNVYVIDSSGAPVFVNTSSRGEGHQHHSLYWYIPVSDVESILNLSAFEADKRFGGNHRRHHDYDAEGAIVVTLKGEY